GFGQRPMQRLGARDRDQPLLVGAAKENGNPHQLLPIRHSGMVRRTRPGISRFRVRCFASPRNDDGEMQRLAMRLRIAHSTNYRYEPPASGVIQILRMTPGSHDGQYVAEWQIDVSTDSRLDMHQDAFGNVTHVLTHGPIADLTIHVEGLIETHDTRGVLRCTDVAFTPSLLLPPPALTEHNPAMATFARA